MKGVFNMQTMKNLSDVMERLGFLKNSASSGIDPGANREIDAICDLLDIFGVKSHFDYSADGTKWVSVLDSQPQSWYEAMKKEAGLLSPASGKGKKS